MRGFLTRFVGIALIVAGIAGLAFSVAGLVVLIEVQKRVEAGLNQQLDLVDRAVSATSAGLQVADTSLLDAGDTVRSMAGTMSGVATAVNGSIPTLDAMSDLLGKKLPATVETAQTTLSSAATSAKGVDDFLMAISRVPLIGTSKYSPDVPLSQGLSQLAASLDGIPDALRSAEGGLTTTTTNLRAMQGQFGDMAISIGQIADSLDRGRSVLTQYEGVTSDLRTGLASIRQSLPGWLRWARWGLSLLLVWLGIAQFALITQGFDLVGRSRHSQVS